MTANLNSTRAQSAARITYQNLSSMKAKADAKPNALALLKKLADATVGESVSFMVGLTQVVVPEQTVCKTDGHVLQSGSTNGKHTCAECGHVINSVHELRAGALQRAIEENVDRSIEYWLDPSLKQRRVGFFAAR